MTIQTSFVYFSLHTKVMNKAILLCKVPVFKFFNLFISQFSPFYTILSNYCMPMLNVLYYSKQSERLPHIL